MIQKFLISILYLIKQYQTLPLNTHNVHYRKFGDILKSYNVKLTQINIIFKRYLILHFFHI